MRLTRWYVGGAVVMSLVALAAVTAFRSRADAGGGASFDDVITPDLVTSKLAALHVYQLAIPAPRPLWPERGRAR